MMQEMKPRATGGATQADRGPFRLCLSAFFSSGDSPPS